MKTNLKLAVALAALTVIIGAASAASAQVKTGGYKEIAKTDARAVSAAEFAVKSQSAKTNMKFELHDVVKAEQQVVAGMNYRLCMEVSADGDEAFHVQAVVYVDLKKNSKLTSWADSDCGDAAPTPAPAPSRAIGGGYREVPAADAGAAAAAEFAINAQGEKTGMEFELHELVKAERQVVAGTNFRLCMQVSADGDEAFFVQAVVYLDLKKNYKLTSWADSDCGD